MNSEKLTKVIEQAKNDKKNARIAKNHYQAYLNSDCRYLWHCYSNPSKYKEEALYRCYNLMNQLCGTDLRIISYNSMQFTVGFEFVDFETGELMFAYITRDYDRFTYL